MSRKFNVLAIISLLVLGAVPLSMADGDVDAGRAKIETCLGCHGIEGYKNTYPTFRVPKLKGQHGKYITASLKAYQSGERSHPTMHSQASTLSEQDIADIAAFIDALNQ